jgi:hypothetical protein
MIRAKPVAAALAVAALTSACAGGKEPPAAQRTAAAPAGAAQPSASEVWRERARAPAELPAGTLVRMASRRPIDRGACPPAEPQRDGKGAAEVEPQPAARPECPNRGDDVEEVEIDWHGAPPSP